MAITRERFDKIAGDGKIASCEFIKKDGSLRKMVFRTQVTKGVTVYDMHERGFRHVNLNTMQWLKAHGETHHV